ncbi:AraC family transcriptional regulator [Achromobacter insolitus]|uniref:AraC family transcriptional regulator n=1 Tax=Achromobacter insolitus TaxID=217204 RepID=UPI0007C2E70D|nr:AraC family transcriptional regulator [Achromobacter insolitus]MDH3064343.1 AraC family transcriptional regulator [Achromobacter insolitus]NGT15670.1 AraC family transcriptional regulator [Achromobacter insolitus]OAD16772.1 AraC family transcriptional regulator [Achromobacter insolitus]
MISLMQKLAPNEGYTQTTLDSVRLMRSDRPLGRTPVLYEPSIVIVCQGRKLGFLGSDVYVYDAQHYLVLSVPLPFSTETQASPDEPMLALSIRLDLLELSELILQIGETGQPEDTPNGMVSTELDDVLAGATVRLLEALTVSRDARILGPGLVREICYRVLTGAQGGAMRAALAHHGRFGRVAKALKRIHADYAVPLSVTRLAEEAGMSVPAFHANFRTVTQTSPIQYIKSTRLHQARLMMIRDGVTAAAAAGRVGYESTSQFSREFKRLFGRTPVEEARDMRESFTLSPPVPFGAEANLTG